MRGAWACLGLALVWAVPQAGRAETAEPVAAQIAAVQVTRLRVLDFAPFAQA